MQRADGSWRFRIYRRGESIPLADMLPLLDQLGLRALDERAFGFGFDGGHRVAARCRCRGARRCPVDRRRSRAEVQRCFVAEFNGSVEVDGLNRLVLLAGLTARQIEVLRAYSRYLRQIGFPFSQQYIEATLARHAPISRLLVGAVRAPLRPGIAAATSSSETDLRAEIAEALDAVPSLDDDRTLRALLALIDATVRTNAFRPADDGGHRPVLSFKFDTSKVPDLPLPRPMFEIWVCSPRVEGVHLRNGRIARGGIRWSDRREDFRTEILGLVKAQIVKNAVIVPTGAKGGFVLKRPPAGADEFRAEGVACYREFISGLLDLTDNIVGGAVVPPPDTVRHDGDDPYLVVAADKGTATFSDIANEISADVRLLARRRVRLRRQRRLRPQGDGHHRTRRVGERAPARAGARQGRRPRRADRRRHRRHVGRRVRQRDAALGAHQARRRVRPSSHLHRSRSRPRGVVRRTQAPVRSAPVELGRTTTRR